METNGRNKVIEVKDVSVKYGDFTVLENINFDVYENEIFVIVGGSGSGKSTVLRQLIGLEKPTEGEVLIDGDSFFDASGEKYRQIIRKFGVLFQSGGLFASMTIAENIALVMETYTDLPEERIVDLVNLKMKAVGLEGFDDYFPSEISGGMKKRAGIARAISLDPNILFFDEPSSGLDPVTAASIDKLINELNSGLGTTMVVISHDLASIEQIAHRVIMLDKSSTGIVAEGTVEELRQMKDKQLVYNFFNRKPAN